jgi:predicted hydrolase (HD superfamily)
MNVQIFIALHLVESVMCYMARKRGDGEEKWGIIGLIPDLDYKRHPDQH